jgi:1,4-alpha-glucan branching enzyme
MSESATDERFLAPLEMTTRGTLVLLLHAHLPFVRHPGRELSHEETWLFEAMTESYIPLLRMMQRLNADGIPFRFTLSISPTLATMLRDPLLLERYVRHLQRLSVLAEKECERNRLDKVLLPLAQFYRDLFCETRRVFVDEWNCDLLAVVRQLHDAGTLDLIASAATHAILPIMQHAPAAAHAQVAIGCDFFREIFRTEPAGFWLPECAYSPGIDQLLQKQNIRWFVLDAHGLEHARPAAKCGTTAPCFTPAGPAAFARDPQASGQIWSAEGGYPGDPAYRDFYRDVGFDLNAEALAPLNHMHGHFTGIKYYRVTGDDGAKQLYVREAAEKMSRKHARHFVEQCIASLGDVEREPAILVAPFDAELFGHWWFEGPLFLEQVIRIAAKRGLAITTPTDFLRQNATLQIVQPASSSWGDSGYLDVWLDEKCGWIYPSLNTATQRMITLASSHLRTASAEQERTLRQLARELLLAQASDWPFQIRNDNGKEYATQRVRDHIARFHRLADAFENGKLDGDFLGQCEERDNLFPHLEWRHFADCHSERSTCHSERSRGISSSSPESETSRST